MNLLVMAIPIWVLTSRCWVSAYARPVWPDPPLPSVSEPLLPTEKQPSSQIPSEMAAHPPGVPEVKIVHHQDLNKRILIALISASSLLSGILLSLFCLCIYRRKSLKKSNSKSQHSQGTLFFFGQTKTEGAPYLLVYQSKSHSLSLLICSCKVKSLHFPLLLLFLVDLKCLFEDAVKGLSLGPILGRFNSLRMAGKKGSVAFIEYQLLVAATNNFQENNVLGEGGFGQVYKARFSDNVFAAVKRLHGGNQDARREFENEVNWLSKIHHQNVVSLLGYCIQGDTRFLVYEMMHNGSLESQLHGPSHGSALTWHIRMKIALDVARGLEFLHECCNPPVIHRDLKSSNILMDSNYNAKLSDFGLAITGGNQSKENIKLSGTLGYVAPEYLLDGKLTDKSDVYAFGVILLELLMGRKPVEKTASSHFYSLVTWALPQLTDRSKLPNIVDPVIRNSMDLKHLFQVAAVAVLCVQQEPSYRPLITDVLHSLIPLVPIELGGSLRG